MTSANRYLLDVNVLVALLDSNHVHHRLASAWFYSPNRLWAICSFTEAGLLRYMTRPRTGSVSMEGATAMLARLTQEPGYSYEPMSEEWRALTAPFTDRIFGHNQIADAYLLGMALREGMVLVTFDKAIMHLAGEHGRSVLVLG